MQSRVEKLYFCWHRLYVEISAEDSSRDEQTPQSVVQHLNSQLSLSKIIAGKQDIMHNCHDFNCALVISHKAIIDHFQNFDVINIYILTFINQS